MTRKTAADSESLVRLKNPKSFPGMLRFMWEVVLSI